MQKCLGCLREGLAGQMDNLYTVALLSYTFTLSGDEKMRTKLITYLHTKSNTQGESARKPRPSPTISPRTVCGLPTSDCCPTYL